MATWEEIVNNPDFQKETMEEKIAVRDSYFNDVIRPNVEAAGDDVEAVRASFNTDNSFQDAVASEVDGMPIVPAPTQQPEELTSLDRGLNWIGDKFEMSNLLPGGALVNTLKGAYNLVTGDEPEEVEPVWFDDNAQWEDVLSDKEFLTQSPVEKRRIADAYFDKFLMPNIPANEVENVRAEFKRDSGIPTLDTTGVAEEQKGVLAKTKDVAVKAGNWLLKDGDTKLQDMADFKEGLGKGVDNLSDWATGGTVIEDSWKAISSIASDVSEFGYDVVFGVSDAEFERMYGVPKSEAGTKMNDLERFRYKKAMDERDASGIQDSLRGEGNAPLVADTVQVREEAEKEAADIGFDVLADVASFLPVVGQVGTGAKALTGLERLGAIASNMAKSSSAAGGAEVVKNIDKGRPLSSGVAEAVIADAALSGLTDFAMKPTKQANKTANTVASGKKKLDDVLKTADESARLDTEFSNALSGKALDSSALNSLNAINPMYKDRIISAHSVAQKASDSLETIFKKDMTADEFVNSARKNIKGKGLTETGVRDWFALRKGEFDEVASLAKTQAEVINLRALSSPEVETYLRATELNQTGLLGRMLADVSDTPTATKLSKATGALQDLTGFGLPGLIGDKMKSTASKKLGKTASEGLARSYDTLMSDVSVTSEMGQKKKALSERLRNDMAEMEMDEFNYRADLEDGVTARDSEFEAKDYPGKISDIEQKLKEIDDWMSDEALRQPLRKNAIEDLAPLLGKDKLSDKQVIQAASALKQTSEGGPLFGGDVNRANREALDKSITALAGRSKNKSSSMSSNAAMGRAVVGGAILTFIGMPAAIAKTGIVIANSLAQKSQKRGLLEGVRLVDKHTATMHKLQAKLDKASGIAAEGVREEMKQATKVFNEKLDTMGSGLLSELGKVLTVSARALDGMAEYEDM